MRHHDQRFRPDRVLENVMAASGPMEHPSFLENLLQRRIEAMALADDRLVCCKDTHPFAQAAHDAFYDHYPLTIGPDDVWFCIAQGFAHHVNLNAELLRHRFVRHQGKLTLVVERPDFALGQPNPWSEVFTAFSEQISNHVGRELRELVVADFSTTTEYHRAATEVALMDTFQGYFEYELRAGCGIPAINLTGAPDDWRNIRRRASDLAKYGLEHWIHALLPILHQIEATSRGQGDREFWQSFFRYRSGSIGGSAMTGWIHVLFPYLRNGEKLVPNTYLDSWQVEYRRAMDSQDDPDWRKRGAFEGPYLKQVPSGVSSAPVKVSDIRSGKRNEMRFVAGMLGITQDPATLSVSPTFGWAVVYEPASGRESRPRGFWRRWIDREA